MVARPSRESALIEVAASEKIPIMGPTTSQLAGAKLR